MRDDDLGRDGRDLNKGSAPAGMKQPWQQPRLGVLHTVEAEFNAGYGTDACYGVS
jgi:hypothetical protein